MNITENQIDGIIILAVLILLFYIIAYHCIYNHRCEYSPGFIDKKKNSIAVEIISDNTDLDGIYFFPENTKVSGALQTAAMTSAGNYGEGTLDINLSGGKIIKGESDGTLSVREMDTAKKLMLDIPLNINRVTFNDLLLIPGIGKRTAGKIIDYRRVESFKSIEDLMKVDGIKEKKFEGLKSYFCINCP